MLLNLLSLLGATYICCPRNVSKTSADDLITEPKQGEEANGNLTYRRKLPPLPLFNYVLGLLSEVLNAIYVTI